MDNNQSPRHKDPLNQGTREGRGMRALCLTIPSAHLWVFLLSSRLILLWIRIRDLPFDGFISCLGTPMRARHSSITDWQAVFKAGSRSPTSVIPLSVVGSNPLSRLAGDFLCSDRPQGGEEGGLIRGRRGKRNPDMITS